MRGFGGFLLFLFIVGLAGVCAYNTYQIGQLQGEIAALHRAPAPSFSAHPFSAHSSSDHPPAHSSPTTIRNAASEEPMTNPRVRKWDDAKREATEAMTALSRANTTAQTASRQTVDDLQKRIAALSQQVQQLSQKVRPADGPSARP